MPDLGAVPGDVLGKAKLLVINFPNSPTGKTAPPEFYERVVALAKENESPVKVEAYAPWPSHPDARWRHGSIWKRVNWTRTRLST